MPFAPTVKEDALVACGRHCCICHKFCGIKIEVAHILGEADGGESTLDNAIPLCFDCHADMRSYDHKHPMGNKYSESELRRHRDAWYGKVEGNIGLADKAEVVATDKVVYRRLCRLLPWDGSIRFIRHNNFAGFSFPWAALKDLDDFAAECENPAFEFVDPDLEGLRAAVESKTREFHGVLAVETFVVGGDASRSSVPEEWEHEQPERFWRVVESLHATAGEIVETYDSLTKTATRKLGLLPETMTGVEGADAQ